MEYGLIGRDVINTEASKINTFSVDTECLPVIKGFKDSIKSSNANEIFSCTSCSSILQKQGEISPIQEATHAINVLNYWKILLLHLRSFAIWFDERYCAYGRCITTISWCCLSQHEQPVLYVSRKLSHAEKNYSNIEREALAIIWACKIFTIQTIINLCCIFFIRKNNWNVIYRRDISSFPWN